MANSAPCKVLIVEDDPGIQRLLEMSLREIGYTCDLTSIFCCLTLSIIEVCRNCDNSLRYFLA